MKFNVDHILVKQAYEAEDLLRQMKSGKLFEDLAKKYSLCPSAAEGGSLGVVSAAKLDSDFAEALENLKIGETSKAPVRTRFGYHIIRRKELP